VCADRIVATGASWDPVVNLSRDKDRP